MSRSSRQLPVFYIPQALAHLLPRIVPRKEPAKYMFASYVPDKREVMARYVDVGVEQPVEIAGQKLLAIPVRDRIGLERVGHHALRERGGRISGQHQSRHQGSNPPQRCGDAGTALERRRSEPAGCCSERTDALVAVEEEEHESNELTRICTNKKTEREEAKLAIVNSAFYATNILRTGCGRGGG